jgi:transglutaminase-like putative cysteine protease
VRAELEEYLRPGWFVDSDAPAVMAFARDAAGDATDPVEQVALLFAAVRDRIWYDPFGISDDPRDYRASAVAAARTSWCVPKAVLLVAASPTCATTCRRPGCASTWEGRTCSSTTATPTCTSAGGG